MRMVADCRDMPSDSGCTLTIVGEADEVLAAAVQHAVSVHQHPEDEQLRSAIRASLKPDGAGRYVQLIEVRTDRFDDLERLHDQWLADTVGERTVTQEWVCRDRDRDDTYVIIVEFPSDEAARVNNDLPATARIAEGMGKLAIGEPTFRNLDLIRRD